jgi:DNA-binding MltR family transcriptional regulator
VTKDKGPQVKTLEEVRTRFNNLFDALNKDSDMVCAIVATSYLNDALGAMLEKFFVGDKTKKRLLKPDGGLLGTLRAKADVAYCLNLIVKERCTAIIRAGEIRNAFAHSDVELKFESDDIRELCSELFQWNEKPVTFVARTQEDLNRANEIYELRIAPARGKFVEVTKGLCTWTIMEAMRLRPSSPYTAVTETAPPDPPSEPSPEPEPAPKREQTDRNP